MAELPALMTLSEIADLFRSKAANRHRAGRAIADRHGLPLVEGHRPGLYLVPGWAVAKLIGAPAVQCPHCGRQIGPEGCPTDPPLRHLEAVGS